MPQNSKRQVQVQTRLPEDIHREVKKLAEEEGRTVAKQLAAVIKTGVAEHRKRLAAV